MSRPPDGRAYSAGPRTHTEAEGRRLERFQNREPAPAPMAAPEEENNPIFPMTLDLRLPMGK